MCGGTMPVLVVVVAVEGRVVVNGPMDTDG